MATLQAFSIARNGTVNVNNFPRWQIDVRIEDVDPVTGQKVVLHDFTGANALQFPNILQVLTDEQRDEFVRISALWIIMTRAGIM